MIVLIVEAHVSRHRIGDPIIEIGNHARALSRRHQPDERLEVEQIGNSLPRGQTLSLVACGQGRIKHTTRTRGRRSREGRSS